MLRIEDLDAPRALPEMVDACQRDLEWLGLDWDGAPELQSLHMDHFATALQSLLDDEMAYACTCTRGDVRRAQSAPQQGDREVRYPGTCRGRYRTPAHAEAESGRGPALRFRVVDGVEVIHDAFAGTATFDVQAEVGDFVVARRNRLPAYQLAVVVDDARQGVTEVLRGDDLLPSTARQLQLQRALKLPRPSWVHVPLVLDEAGRRLAKRADDLSLAELRTGGADPRAIVAWAARTSGIEVPDRATAAAVTRHFDLAHLPSTPVRLDPATVAALRNARE